MATYINKRGAPCIIDVGSIGVGVRHGEGGLGTYENTAGGGLSGDEFARPVLGLGHERALELLLAALRLLLLLLRVVGRIFGLLAAAEEGERAPYQHDEQPGEERTYRRQQEAPVLALAEAVVRVTGVRVLGSRVRRRHAGRPFASHASVGGGPAPAPRRALCLAANVALSGARHRSHGIHSTAASSP